LRDGCGGGSRRILAGQGLNIVWGRLAGALIGAAIIGTAGAAALKPAAARELQWRQGAQYQLQCRDNLLIGLDNIVKSRVSADYSADFTLITGNEQLKLPLIIHPMRAGGFYLGESQISNDYVAFYPSYDKDYPQKGDNVLIIMGSADILPQMRPVAACIVKD